MDVRHLKMINDKSKVVWQCLHCDRKFIGDRYTKPDSCPCKQAEFVIAGTYIVTKSERE